MKIKIYSTSYNKHIKHLLHRLMPIDITVLTVKTVIINSDNYSCFMKAQYSYKIQIEENNQNRIKQKCNM